MFLCASDTASAQDPDAARASPVEGFLEGGMRIARVADRTTIFSGGAALLRLTRSWSVGGAGYVQNGASRLRIGGSDADVAVGYGGLLLEWSPPTASPAAGTPADAGPDPSFTWGVRLLLGAGNAEIRSPTVGSRIGSDNFSVTEPGVSLGIRRWQFVEVGAQALYRLAFFVDDLGEIGSDDVGGASLGFFVRIGPF